MAKFVNTIYTLLTKHFSLDTPIRTTLWSRSKPMSADFINSIGARGPQIPLQQPVVPRPVSEAAPSAPQEALQTQAPAASFAPSVEAQESSSESAAGEARASQILAAWGGQDSASQIGPGPLSVQGAENTSVHAVHGAQNGVYSGGGATQPGFSEATVYSSRPPVN